MPAGRSPADSGVFHILFAITLAQDTAHTDLKFVAQRNFRCPLDKEEMVDIIVIQSDDMLVVFEMSPVDICLVDTDVWCISFRSIQLVFAYAVVPIRI